MGVPFEEIVAGALSEEIVGGGEEVVGPCVAGKVRWTGVMVGDGDVEAVVGGGVMGRECCEV